MGFLTRLLKEFLWALLTSVVLLSVLSLLGWPDLLREYIREYNRALAIVIDMAVPRLQLVNDFYEIPPTAWSTLLRLHLLVIAFGGFLLFRDWYHKREYVGREPTAPPLSRQSGRAPEKPKAPSQTLGDCIAMAWHMAANWLLRLVAELSRVDATMPTASKSQSKQLLWKAIINGAVWVLKTIAGGLLVAAVLYWLTGDY